MTLSEWVLKAFSNRHGRRNKNMRKNRKRTFVHANARIKLYLFRTPRNTKISERGNNTESLIEPLTLKLENQHD